MKNKFENRCLIVKLFYYKPSFMKTDRHKRKTSHEHVYKNKWYNYIHRVLMYRCCFQINK